MSKPLSFVVPLTIYPGECLVSFGQTDEHVKKMLNKSELKEKRCWQYGEGTLARCGTFKSGNVLIRMRGVPKEPKEHGTLAHEIFHAAVYVLQRIGVVLSEDSEESFAYLIGYLTREIYSRL